MSRMSTDDFHFVSSLVHQRAAIVLGPGKEYLVASRLDILARDESLSSHLELIARLRERPDPVLARKVVEAMTTNETSFFRDQNPFEGLARVVLPQLIARRQASRRLSIWSAACSTGQEAYSIWMLLHDRFPELADWDVRILGTDLSGDVLAKARTGRYTQLEVGHGLPGPLLARHFTKDGTHWQIDASARAACEFRQLNLAEPWPAIPPVDVVFLRNVLIYFDSPTKRKILSRTASVLAPDGFLFLGAGETTLGLEPSFRRVPLERGCCFCTSSSRADAQGGAPGVPIGTSDPAVPIVTQGGGSFGAPPQSPGEGRP